MRKWAKGAAGATLLTASFVALGAVPALADVTNGDGSILGGNQVNAPISVPVDISGNSVAVIGRALAGSKGGSFVRGVGGSGGAGHTSGRHSIGGGNQINAPISAPVNACGNGIAVVGRALAGCEGGAGVRGVGGYAGGGHHTSGAHSILGGNQVHAPVNAPIDVCGNAAAVLGRAVAGCAGSLPGAGGYYGGGFHGRTSGRGSIGGGNQVHAPVNAPVDVCGNGVAVVGHALGSCGADTSGYNGGDDCITPSSYRTNGLPQLPVDPQSLGTGAMPVAMGATPALPKLSGIGLGDAINPQSATASNPLGGLGLPTVGGLPKQLPPLKVAAAESSTGSQNGALLALALGGMFAASAGTVSVARRLRRR